MQSDRASAPANERHHRRGGRNLYGLLQETGVGSPVFTLAKLGRGGWAGEHDSA